MTQRIILIHLIATLVSGRAITQAIYPKGKNGGLGYAEVSYRF